MGAHRYQSTWRSLTFNRVYDDSGIVDDPTHLVSAYANSDYRLESLDPTSVQVVDYREMRQHLEGAEPNQSFEGVRIITGRGLILASTAADLEDKTWAMYEAFSPAACRIAFDLSTPRGVGPFDFKRASAGAAKALRFYCKPAAGRPIVIGRQREGLSRPFLFQLVALDPFAYAQTLTSTTLGTGGGTVSNAGNIYTHPKIYILMSGAGSASFTMTNAATGQTLGLDLSSFTNGNEIAIDTLHGTIEQPAGTNKLSKLVSGFPSNMVLLAGNNAISFTNTTGITSVRFDFRAAYA
jgi:hypothetical protein